MRENERGILTLSALLSELGTSVVEAVGDGSGQAGGNLQSGGR